MLSYIIHPTFREETRLFPFYEIKFGVLKRSKPHHVFTEQENSAYINEIISERPPIRLWAEQSLQAARKTAGHPLDFNLLKEERVSGESAKTDHHVERQA